MRHRNRKVIIPHVRDRALPVDDAGRVELLLAAFDAASCIRLGINIHESSEPLASHALRVWCESRKVGIETRWLEGPIGRPRVRLLKATTLDGCEINIFCKESAQ